MTAVLYTGEETFSLFPSLADGYIIFFGLLFRGFPDRLMRFLSAFKSMAYQCCGLHVGVKVQLVTPLEIPRDGCCFLSKANETQIAETEWVNC